MVKFFYTVGDRDEVAAEINQFAEENNLEVVSLSCSGNTGIFVAFKQKSQN